MLSIEEYVRRYFMLAEICTLQFCDVFLVKTPTEYWSQDRVSNKTGCLSEGVNFEFHGIGCAFYFDAFIVESITIDYTRNGFLAVSAWTISKNIKYEYGKDISPNEIAEWAKRSSLAKVIPSAVGETDAKYNIVARID